MQTQMTSLDLSGTGLSHADMNQFIIEIVKREINLTKLNLGSNDSVCDEVIEDLCQLFSQHSTMQQLMLDNTKITTKGLAMLLESMTHSLKVRTISVRNCRMQLSFIRGKPIIASLQKNISLTNLDFTDNTFDMPFKLAVDKELDLNQQIVNKILPQLISQEVNARGEKRR